MSTIILFNNKKIHISLLIISVFFCVCKTLVRCKVCFVICFYLTSTLKRRRLGYFFVDFTCYQQIHSQIYARLYYSGSPVQTIHIHDGIHCTSTKRQRQALSRHENISCTLIGQHSLPVPVASWPHSSVGRAAV